MGIIKLLFVLLLTVLFLGGGIAVGMTVSALQDVPEFNPENIEAGVPSVIKDPDGNEIIQLDREQYREEISIEEVPEDVKNAFIAIEDARFYEHPGVDIRGITRAAVNNFQETGNPFVGSQGGSTITQQLVKNAFLSPEQLLERKIHEAWLALHLERHYTKDEIMEFYLNYATYFHHNAYGIQAASHFYYDKDVSELDTEEGALLAAIIRHPGELSPHRNPDLAEDRKNTVLRLMRELELISEREFRTALNRELDDMLAKVPEDDYPYPHFIDYVINEEALPILRDKMEDMDGLPEEVQEAEDLLYYHGLTIHTTIDRDLQTHAQEVIDDPNNYPETWEDEDGVVQPQSALVVAEPDTGRVRALVGGRDYGLHNVYNRVSSTRSPGSAMKPINVYAPAFEEGLKYPGSVIDDAPTVWDSGGGTYAPENFNRTFKGLVTVREALVYSYNVPAVKVFEDELNREIGLDYAVDLGINTFVEEDYYNQAAAIGGLTRGVKPFEITEAYSTLANQGVNIDHHTITKIEDRRGNVIYEHDPNPQPVLSEETAWLITDILSDVVNHGTAGALNLDFPAAAKTGTSQNLRDAWLVTYTPHVVTSFWLGYDEGPYTVDNRTHYTISVTEDIMTRAMEGKNPDDFSMPDGIAGPVALSEASGKRPSEHTPDGYITYDYFPAGEVPSDECDMFVEKEICTAENPYEHLDIVEEYENLDEDEQEKLLEELGVTEEELLLHGDHDETDENGEYLAAEYCPSETTEKKIFLDREEPKTTDNRWTHGAGRTTADKGLMPPDEEELCEIHTEEDIPDITEEDVIIEDDEEDEEDEEENGFLDFLNGDDEEEDNENGDESEDEKESEDTEGKEENEEDNEEPEENEEEDQNNAESEDAEEDGLEEEDSDGDTEDGSDDDED